jgi:hypothetical protein
MLNLTHALTLNRSSYEFSYDCNNVFECVGLQNNSSFSLVTDYEENIEKNE